MFMFLCANSVQGGFVAVFVFAYADYACIPTHHALSEHEGSICFLLPKKGATTHKYTCMPALCMYHDTRISMYTDCAKFEESETL